MKKVISVLLLVAIALSVCACGSSNARQRYIGTWSDETGNVVLVVNSSSKVSLRMGTDVYSGTWSLQITDADPDEDIGMFTNRVENMVVTLDAVLFEVAEETVPAVEGTVPEETAGETTAETTAETTDETTGETVAETTPAETAPTETTPAKSTAASDKTVVNFTYRIIDGVVYLVTEGLPGSSYYALEKTK